MRTGDIYKPDNSQLGNFFEISLDMLCISGADGYFKRVNPAFTQTLGWSTEEMLARPFLDFVHHDDHVATLGEVERLLARGGNSTLRFENRCLHKDGSYRLLSWVCAHNSNGLIFSTARDMTAVGQEAAQQAGSIRELADFKAALDQHAIVATTDARGTITYANDKFCAISKYARAELIGQNHRLINSGYHPQTFFDELWQTIASGRVWKGEIRNRAKDGTFYWVDTTIVPFLDAQGKPFQYIAIRADINERKRVEAALLSARDAADRASLAKDSFLATMSHEIRTPLGGLMGMLELLGFTPLNHDQRETVQAAMDSGQSLLRIVNDILDWSKIEAGKLALSPQPTSLARLVASVVNTYARVASARSLIVEQHIDARLDSSHLVDPLRLSQVLNNFVSNALKFTPKGQVEVRADLLDRDDGVERVRFSVRDTGIGIAPDVQANLFQSFQQGTSDTARMYGGTGLGLSICRSLADMMGGQIDLESAPGTGSTFSITLTLPVSQQAAEPLPVAPVVMDVTHMPANIHKEAKADAPLVLVVDDHPINRKLMEIQLGILGLRSEMAENGEAALARWRDGKFDLIITDCHMPKMDGYALTRALRKHEADDARHRTPVIAWTANALVGEAERCHAAGMDELLVKPADLARLKATLSKCLIVAKPAGHGAPGFTAAAPIDFKVLNELTGDAAENAEILRDFMQQTRSDLAALEDAQQKRDIPASVRVAHRMKGASRMVGAGELAAVCMAAENAARQGKLEGADAVASALERLVKFLAEEASRDEVKKWS